MPPTVPFNDLRRQAASVGERLGAVAQRVISSGTYLLGPETDAFESEFAAWCGVARCVAVANGTDALELALRSIGCETGDEVVVAANAGGYATAACLAIGATPTFADVDAETLLLSPEGVAAAVTDRTRAVVATHLYGNVADITGMRAALGPSVAIIEDCAQAHGASRDGHGVGSMGDAGAFSFYPTKNLGALGDGGAVLTNDAELAQRARALRQYGWGERYVVERAGGRNSRLDELQAALLRDLLPSVPDRNACRSAIRQQYLEAFGDRVEFVPVAPGTRSATHLCVVRSPARDQLIEDLRQAGVSCAVHYPVPDHRQPALVGLHRAQVPLPETERACDQVLSLPCFPELDPAEIDQVIDAVRKAA